MEIISWSAPTESSPDFKDFFDNHHCPWRNNQGKGCVLCHRILYYDNYLVGTSERGLADEFLAPTKKNCQDQVENHMKVIVPLPEVEAMLKAVLTKSPDSIVNSAGDQPECIKRRYSLFFASVFADVFLARTNTGQLEAYFDGFYINLLRQLLDLAGFKTIQRDKNC